MERSDEPGRTGPTIALIGGVLLAAGALLTWANIAITLPGTGEERHAIGGMTTSSGTLVLAAGIIVVAVSLVALLWRRGGGLGLGAAVAELAAGGLGAILGILFLLDMQTRAVDAVIADAAMDPAKFGQAGTLILTDASAVVTGWGLYFVILGGATAFVGGMLAAFDLRRSMVRLAADDEVADDDGEAA